MDYGHAIQLLAMNAVLNGDPEYRIRSILRWYSQKFYTPLHVVETLPLDDVLRHFYEQFYFEMDDEDKIEEIKLLVETDEERDARLKAADKAVVDDKAAEEEFIKRSLALKETEKKKEAEKIKKSVDESMKKLQEVTQKLNELPEIKLDFSQNNDLMKEIEEADAQWIKKDKGKKDW